MLGYHFLVDNRGMWGANAKTLFGEHLVSPFRYGWLGVEFFFVISGFVICMSAWGRPLSKFFTSRVVRLMPAYLFAMLLTAAVLTLWPMASRPIQLRQVLLNTAMLNEFFHVPGVDNVYWTLFVELKFYIVFAVLVAFGLTYKRVFAFCAVWALAALYSHYLGPAAVLQLTEAGYAPYFIFGIGLYLLYRNGPNLLVFGLVLVSLILCVATLELHVKPHNTKFVAISYQTATLIFLFFGLVMIAVSLHWFTWLRWRGLVVVGALTYPLYLLHNQLSRVIVSRLRDTVHHVLLLALLLTVMLLLAYAVHRIVERPLSHKLKAGLDRAFTQISAPASSK